MINITKTCLECKESKSFDDFQKNKNGKHGLHSKCKTCLNKKTKEWRNNNPSYFSQWKNDNSSYHHEWYEKNKEDVKSKVKSYQQSIPDYYSKRSKEYRKKYPHIYKWRSILDNTLSKQNKTKNDTTHNLLGYSHQQLKEHLENQNIDWNNDQVDHKIPVSWFKPETPVSIVNDLRNLQPLSKEKNQSKGNKYADKVSLDYFQIIKQWILLEKINNIYYG
jgi:hypothetical protein